LEVPCGSPSIAIAQVRGSQRRLTRQHLPSSDETWRLLCKILGGNEISLGCQQPPTTRGDESMGAGGGGGGWWRHRRRLGRQTTGPFHWMRGERRPRALPAGAASGMLAWQPRRAAGASGCQMRVCPARSAYRAGPRRARPCHWPCLKASHTAASAPHQPRRAPPNAAGHGGAL
jgi:hypothetical protein